ncbi:ribosomal maturation YjgA family protein [Clostridium guangxiense]|uniref:ribosomal maturation YjgA family protein n=1 Tax=Clostridium guangxiense TaxID=1662055 RepID=UPI001E5A35AB|nr:DUF2809 domain-containing protein [Clostridium guangxiense]MCD2345470.1 DUF2809 domain-containing protein [Clostridium guangxiense]
MKFKRNRSIYGLIIVVIIIFGIYSKRVNNFIPDSLNDYLGDSLWAVMIFFGFGFIFKDMDTKKIALSSILFCYIIELSQLYHANWIDDIRRTTLGGLILGYTFSWSDLIAYAVGIGTAVVLEMILKKYCT